MHVDQLAKWTFHSRYAHTPVMEHVKDQHLERMYLNVM